MTIRESKFFLDPTIIKNNHFKIVEFEVFEYFFESSAESKDSERKIVDNYQLRVFMDSDGYPDSLYYYGNRRKRDRKWVKSSIDTYFEFLPDSIRRTGAAKTTYNDSGLISRQELISNDLHDCCNPKVSINKYTYDNMGKVTSFEFIQKNSTPAQVVDSTHYEFKYMDELQVVRKTSLNGNLKSNLFCFDKDQIIQSIIVFDNNVNDASLRINVTYKK